MAPFIHGSYVEADADADEAVLAGVDTGGAEDAGAEVAGAEDVGVLGEVGADVVGVGVGNADVGEAEVGDGDGDGEADEERALGDADGDWEARADADADALAGCDVPWDDDAAALAEEDALREADEEEDAEPDTPGRHVRLPWMPLLPLIQMREDRPELRHQNLAGYHHAAHTTPACRIPGSHGLFSGKP